METSLLQYLLVWGRVRSIEKKMFIWNSDLVSLILLNFQEKNASLTETNHYLLSCSLDRVGYLQINLAPHSQPRTKLAQRHCDSFTCRVAGHSCGMCEPSQCSAPLKKLSSHINSTVCVLEDCHVGYCSVGSDKYLSLDADRVTAMVLQAVSFDQWKWCDPLENFVLQSLAKFVYCRCDMLWQQLWWLFDLWSKLNQEPRSCSK